MQDRADGWTRGLRPEIRSFVDPFWDHGPRPEVEADLRARFQRQLCLSAFRARAYRERVPLELLRAQPAFTREDIARVPLLSKQTLRGLDPADLLVDPNEPYYLVRGSGGTTGAPVSVFWSRADWTASTHAMLRFCEPLQRLGVRRIWNGYNQSHVSGPAFDDLARALGATPIPRHFRGSDALALDEMARIRPDALVLTPKSGSGKGGSMEDLLAVDPSFLRRLGIRALIVSSTPLERDLLEEVREQGVEAIVNFYGSTEAPPAAASCEADPTMFHLAEGHVLVEVIGADGRQVANGERGLIVVSRIGGEGPEGLTVASGTQLIRYLVGDTARYLTAPCACGRSSPRIAEIARVTDLSDKLEGGCERWE